MPEQKTKLKIIPYFDGINALVSSNVAKPEELLHAENARSPFIGTVEKRQGYTVLGTATAGATFVATGNYGLMHFNKVATGTNTGLYRVSAVTATPTVCNIYYLNTSNVWTILIGAGSSINIGTFDYTIAEENLYLVNYTDKNRYISGVDGTTVITSDTDTGNLYHSLKSKKINYYKNKLYLANCISNDGLTTYPTLILRSSPPVGILALVNGDPVSPYGTIDVTETKYVYTPQWQTQTVAPAVSWRSIAIGENSGGANVVAAAYGGYIYTSADYGATWTAKTNSGLRNWTSVCVSDDFTKMIACVSSGYIYISSDSGATWTQKGTSLGWLKVSCNSSGQNVVAVDSTGGLGYIHYSGDYGATWTQATAAGNNDYTSVVIARSGATAYAVSTNQYVQYSSDYGATWTTRTASGIASFSQVVCDSGGLKVAVAISAGHVMTSIDAGVTWTTQYKSGSYTWRGMIASSDLSKIILSTNNQGVYISTDYGVTWMSQPVLTNNVYSLAMIGSGSFVIIGQQNSPYKVYTLSIISTNGNLLDVYRGGQHIALLRVLSVSETSLLIYDIGFDPGISTILSSDEIWAYNTFNSKQQFRWATNPATGGVDVKEYDSFKLTSEDESGITMLANIGNMMMIANRSALAAWNDYILTNFDTNVGCVSDRGYVKSMGSLFFVHYTGIYATTGGAPQLISSKVEPYFNGATKAGLEAATAGRVDRSVLFHIGNVTLYNPDGSVKKNLVDVVLEYSITQENWFVHTGINASMFATYISSTNPDQLLFSSSETNYPVCTMFSGNNDNGREIPMRMDLSHILLPEALENIAYPSDIILESERGSALHCFVSMDGGDYYELPGTIKKGLSVIKVTGKDLNSDDAPGSLPRTRRLSISLRDTSKQLSKLSMCGIKYIESPEIQNDKPNVNG